MLNDAHTALQEVQQNQLDAVLLAGKMGGIIGLLAFGAAGVTYAYKKRHPRVNVPMSQGPKNPIDKLAETKQEKIRRVENATTPR
jgi:hypothetical protein